MNNVLLGNIPAMTDQLVSPPNPDGTYNISLPPDASSSDGAVVAKETDEPTGESGNNEGNSEGEGNGEGADVKKYLPFIMAGAALLFLFYMKRKK